MLVECVQKSCVKNHTTWRDNIRYVAIVILYYLILVSRYRSSSQKCFFLIVKTVKIPLTLSTTKLNSFFREREYYIGAIFYFDFHTLHNRFFASKPYTILAHLCTTELPTFLNAHNYYIAILPLTLAEMCKTGFKEVWSILNLPVRSFLECAPAMPDEHQP